MPPFETKLSSLEVWKSACRKKHDNNRRHRFRKSRSICTIRCEHCSLTSWGRESRQFTPKVTGKGGFIKRRMRACMTQQEDRLLKSNWSVSTDRARGESTGGSTCRNVKAVDNTILSLYSMSDILTSSETRYHELDLDALSETQVRL